MFGASEDPLHELVFERGQRALKEADVLILVVDGREGLVPGDRDIASEARQTNRPIILAINKMDDRRAKAGALEFYQLGLEPVFEVSAEHGEGVGDLLDAVIQHVAGSPRRTHAAPPADDEEDDAPAGAAWHRRRSLRGDRRPAQRRQVVAGQSLAARGADDRQRDAGHDARRGGHAC